MPRRGRGRLSQRRACAVRQAVRVAWPGRAASKCGLAHSAQARGRQPATPSAFASAAAAAIIHGGRFGHHAPARIRWRDLPHAQRLSRRAARRERLPRARNVAVAQGATTIAATASAASALSLAVASAASALGLAVASAASALGLAVASTATATATAHRNRCGGVLQRTKRWVHAHGDPAAKHQFWHWLC
jgi:hypothetical protein